LRLLGRQPKKRKRLLARSRFLCLKDSAADWPEVAFFLIKKATVRGGKSSGGLHGGQKSLSFFERLSGRLARSRFLFN
jgi:hypothetical protein